MAFTKIAAAGIGSTGTVILEDIRANSLVVSGVSTLGSVVATTGTFSGNVSIAGTLTYEDVTNIDSVGLITARSGVVVNTGTATTALLVNGDARITGILTIGTSSVTLDGTNNQVNVGTGVTIHHTNGVQVGGNTLHSSGLTVNSLNASGIVTATSFVGSGANLTGIAGTANVVTNSLVVSGVTTVAAGSSSIPSISPTGDSNTGIFFPSADTVSIGEGGVEALRINDRGQILLGVSGFAAATSPTASYTQYTPLHLIGGTGTNNGSSIFIARNTPSTNAANQDLGNVIWGTNDGAPFARIGAWADGTPTGSSYPGYLSLQTTNSSATTPTERIRVNQGYSGATKGIVEVNLAYNDNASTTGWGFKVNPGSGTGGNATTGGFYYDSSAVVANFCTHYGIYIKNTGGGTGDQRYGGYFEVTSGNSGVSNYGVYAKANTIGNEGLYSTIYAIRGEATSVNTGTTASVVGAYFSNNNWVNGRCLDLNDAYSVSASHNLVYITRNGNNVGQITTTLSAVTYGSNSDYRLKENVVPLVGAIDRLKQLKPKRFNFIVDPGNTVDGFIAHEVQEVVPQAVSGTKDETKSVPSLNENKEPIFDENGNQVFEEEPVYQGMDQSKLVPLLTAALQEALAEIETLKELKSEVTSLQARLDAAGI